MTNDVIPVCGIVDAILRYMKNITMLGLIACAAMTLSGCAIDDNESSIIDPQNTEAAVPLIQAPCASGYSPGLPEKSLSDSAAAL